MEAIAIKEELKKATASFQAAVAVPVAVMIRGYTGVFGVENTEGNRP